jgi:hypothetical protein
MKLTSLTYRFRTLGQLLAVVAALALGCLASVVLFINATPGHFQYADRDGCACVVSYTTHSSQPHCAVSRSQQCDARPDQFLLLVATVDFNP